MQSGRDNVLICVPCLLVGGTEVHTAMLAGALAAGGYRVTVCAYYEHDPITVAAVEATGAQVVLLGLTRGGGVAGTARLLAALGRVIRRHRPNVVHVQYMTPGVAPLVAARAASVPHVLSTIHVTANHYGRRAWLPRTASRMSDAFVCVSGIAERSFFGSAEAFSEAGYLSGRRHFTIHNGVDLSAVDGALAEQRAQAAGAAMECADGHVVAVIGRLEHVKGQDVLLRALAAVRSRCPSTTALVIGDGPARDGLVALTERLGLKGHVRFVGRVPQATGWRLACAADVIAMPSRPGLEGFGLVAAEAMALRKPVVASNVDGLAEVVGSDGAGVLVPPDDAPALARAVLGLLADARQREAIAEAGRRRVEQNFSVDLFAERHLELYRVVGTRSTTRQTLPLTMPRSIPRACH